MTTLHISTIIKTSTENTYTYTYVRRPENLATWASGLASSEVTTTGDTFIARSPMGDIVMWFTPDNQYGVLDHWVKTADGTVFYNPMRVIKHPEGCEVIFTLRKLDMGDAQFKADAATVAADLHRLKEILETSSPRP